MIVRPADLNDLGVLCQFTYEEACAAEELELDLPKLEKGIRMALEGNAPASYWVLEDKAGKPVGSVSVVREWSDWNAGYYWWIQSMYVSPVERGKGRMTMLLSAVRDALKKAGGLELRLYVHRDNSRAVSAYKKAGFQQSDYEIMTFTGF